MKPARAWVPDRSRGPGRLAEVELPLVGMDERSLRVHGLVVTSDGPAPLFETDVLRFDPCQGGGPLASVSQHREARSFGVVNATFHLHRGLQLLGRLLGGDLPPLVARIGAHEGEAPHWAGGHYRLPAERYSSLPERRPPSPDGEIHLGTGRRYLATANGPYFDAPAHTAAIVAHELGHHFCRHTADFRLCGRRPRSAQANRKVPLDEGTADYLTAVLLRTPDIYGWHRASVPSTLQARRRLDMGWTMAAFRGGSEQDPHADGTVWASALWSARSAVEQAGHPGEAFDQILGQALIRIGRFDADVPWDEALRRRRHFSGALTAILQADEARGGLHGTSIERAFASHGILTGRSNRELRDKARAGGAMPAIGLDRWAPAPVAA